MLNLEICYSILKAVTCDIFSDNPFPFESVQILYNIKIDIFEKSHFEFFIFQHASSLVDSGKNRNPPVYRILKESYRFFENLKQNLINVNIKNKQTV